MITFMMMHMTTMTKNNNGDDDEEQNNILVRITIIKNRPLRGLIMRSCDECDGEVFALWFERRTW